MTNHALYDRFAALLLQRCGLFYPERKRIDLIHGLEFVLRQSGLADLEAVYAAALADELIWDLVIQRLTVGETYFLRNKPQFRALAEHILPELMARRAPSHALRLWSAGCASGEEAYSLAMLLSDATAADPAWQVSILATDINAQALADAELGSYSAWSFREVEAAVRDRFFTASGAGWQIQPVLRRMVRFARLNLAEPCYPQISNGTCAMDLIMCRNVTIYFDAATTQQVIDRFYDALTPGGWLIVGHAEPQASVYQRFETHNFPDTVVYRKPLQAPLFAFDQQSGTFTAGTAPVLVPKPPVVDPPAPRLVEVAAPRPAAPRLVKPVPDRVPLSIIDSPPAPTLGAPSGPPATAVAVASMLEAAQRAYASQQWALAEQHCHSVLERDPLALLAHYLLGQLYERQAQYSAALAAYRRTVYLDRRFIAGMLGLARVWQHLERPVDAQRCYRNTLALLSKLPPKQPIIGLAHTAGELCATIRQQLEPPP